MFDLDPDDAALTIGGSSQSRQRPRPGSRMQVVPGAHLHLPVAADGGGEFSVGAVQDSSSERVKRGPWRAGGPWPRRCGAGVRMEDPGRGMRTSTCALVSASPWPSAMPSSRRRRRRVGHPRHRATGRRRCTCSTVARGPSIDGEMRRGSRERSTCHVPSSAGRSTDRTSRPRWAVRPSLGRE